jgi:hypothetical protein
MNYNDTISDWRQMMVTDNTILHSERGELLLLAAVPNWSLRGLCWIAGLTLLLSVGLAALHLMSFSGGLLCGLSLGLLYFLSRPALVISQQQIETGTYSMLRWRRSIQPDQPELRRLLATTNAAVGWKQRRVPGGYHLRIYLRNGGYVRFNVACSPRQLPQLAQELEARLPNAIEYKQKVPIGQ